MYTFFASKMPRDVHVLISKTLHVKWNKFVDRITVAANQLNFFILLFSLFFFSFFFFFYLWWILSYIKMKQPRVYMCSPSQSPLPPHSPPVPSRFSQCTRSERLSHASNLGWSFLKFSFIHLFLAVLGLHCCVLTFSSCRKQGLLSSCGAQASHCNAFSYCGAWAVEHGL